MTKVFWILFLVAALTSSAFADTGSEDDMHGNGSGPSTMGRTGRRGGGKQLNPDPGTHSPGTIIGNSGTKASTSNPIPGACVNLLLVLNDETGAEVEKTRTTVKGHFEFAGEAGKNYTIASGSKFYEVVAPQGLIHGGDRVNLQLQQKQ